MVDDINKINAEINKLRAELGKKSLQPFDIKDLEKAKALFSALGAEVREMSSDLDYVAKSFKDSVNELANQKSYLSDAKKSLNGIADISQKITNYRKGESSLTEKQLKDLQKQAKFKFDELRNIKQIGNLSKENQLEIIQALNEQDLFNKSVEKTIDYQKDVNKEIGLLGTGIGGLGTMLSKLGFGDLSQPLTDAIEKTKNARLQMKLNNDVIKEVSTELELQNTGELTANQLRAGFGGKHLKNLQLQKDALNLQNKELETQTDKYKNIGDALKEQFTKANLIDFAVKQMIEALKSVDSLAGDTAKQFNISYKEASQLNNQLTNTAALSMDAAVNTKGLNESMMAVGKTLGSNAKLNDADLITFTKLREQAGYTNDELASIQTLSLANGKSLEDNTAEILGGAQAYASQNKLIVNEKEVLKEVGKASASLKLSLGGSASALAESVVKAKQFGLNLEQASKISSGLLNFEDSISSELEAELLTGKDLNLEQARLLALNGDIAGAAAEVAKQVGSSADFGKMNVIQQEAIAKSVGMSRDELAQSLIDKEALNKLSGVEGKDAKEKFDNLVKQVGMEEAKKRLGNDQLANQFKQQSAQEKMANMASKMQEIFIAIAEPIMAIVSPLIGLATQILPAINAILLPITFTLQKIGEGFQNAFEISKAILDPTKSLKDTFKELGVLGSILGGVFTIIALPIELISEGFENISKMISSVMDPTKTLLDTFKEMGPVASFIATALGAAGIAVSTVLLPGLIRSAAAAIMALGPMIATAMAAMSTAISSTLGVGAIPIIAGIAAVAGTIAAVTSLSDGIVDPKGGLVVSGEKGTYKLDENDSIVAGTDINKPKKSTSMSPPSAPSIDLSPLMERINVLIDAVKAGGDVYLDATKVGTAMNVGTYKVQ